MKFPLTPVAVALIAAASALAQESASSTPASSPLPLPSASSSDAAATTAASGGSAASACNVLPGYNEGTVRVPDYGCAYPTTTPPYDSIKLQSYLIGGHSRGPEGEHISDVASDMAKTVVKLYPTLTASLSNIALQYVTAIEASISAARQNPQLVADSAMGIHTGKIASVAAAAVAAVAGSAFFL